MEMFFGLGWPSPLPQPPDEPAPEPTPEPPTRFVRGMGIPKNPVPQPLKDRGNEIPLPGKPQPPRKPK
jgi:hypothetical protein